VSAAWLGGAGVRVFGIDPGSTVTGFGVVESSRGRLLLISSGCVRTSAAEPMGQRLARIHQALYDAIGAATVDAVAIEAIFRHKSSESALRLGQARGVALLAAAQHGFEAVAYNPMTVKSTVGAHGGADKDGVARMVRMLIGEVVPGPADVTDAIAIAITHCQHARSSALLGGAR